MTRHAPMDGLKVVDFTSMMSGPFCTRLLADCGADVIKIEAAGGDYMRHRSPLRDGSSSYYGQMNCGKRSIVLDLKDPRGNEIARGLVARADVVVENFRPGVMKSLRLDYDSLKTSCPDLVYCSISGFGQTGRRARFPAYAPIIHAASGYDLAHMSYNADLERPAKTGIFTADAAAAIYAFGAIQTALLHRERHGGGQHVDVSLLESTLNLLVYEFQEAQFRTDQRRPLYQPLKAADGFVMVAPVNQTNFENLARVVGRADWLRDPRFSNVRGREQNWALLMDEIEQWTQTRSAGECEDVLVAAGVPCSRYRTVAEWVEDDDLRAIGSIVETRDRAGPFAVPNPPFKLSNAVVGAQPSVSEAGQDSDEILRDVLGLSVQEIDALAASGAMRRAAP